MHVHLWNHKHNLNPSIGDVPFFFETFGRVLKHTRVPRVEYRANTFQPWYMSVWWRYAGGWQAETKRCLGHKSTGLHFWFHQLVKGRLFELLFAFRHFDVYMYYTARNPRLLFKISPDLASWFRCKLVIRHPKTDHPTRGDCGTPTFGWDKHSDCVAYIYIHGYYIIFIWYYWLWLTMMYQ